MPRADIHFPRNFLWGTATSSHQVEGRNSNNNWSAWEQEPDRIIGNAKAGLACDWWGGRWKEDLDRAAASFQNAHRFSVEWSRVQPRPDRWDESAIDFYRDMARGMVERNIKPMLTLHHFTDPLWMFEQDHDEKTVWNGGWEREDAPELFVGYVRKVVTALKEYVDLWVTLNEPNVYLNNGWLSGEFPPGKNDPQTAFRVATNLIKGHAAAYQVIHELQPQAQVGIAHHYRNFVPAHRGSPLDKILAKIIFQNFNHAFLDTLTDGRFKMFGKSMYISQANGTMDFVGINYYTNNLISFTLNPKALFMKLSYPQGVLLSPTGFLANQPEGMYQALHWAKRYNQPIYVTENGVEDAPDTLRPRYLIEHLMQVWRAVNFNWPIRGYFHWSLVDNFEWERAWTQRFGLWELDVNTQARIRRRSVDLYQAVCKENGITSEIVEEFAPALYTVLYPG